MPVLDPGSGYRGSSPAPRPKPEPSQSILSLQLSGWKFFLPACHTLVNVFNRSNTQLVHERADPNFESLLWGKSRYEQRDCTDRAKACAQLRSLLQELYEHFDIDCRSASCACYLARPYSNFCGPDEAVLGLHFPKHSSRLQATWIRTRF